MPCSLIFDFCDVSIDFLGRRGGWGAGMLKAPVGKALAARVDPHLVRRSSYLSHPTLEDDKSSHGLNLHCKLNDYPFAATQDETNPAISINST